MPEAPPPRVGRETAARIDPAHARAAEPGYREVAEAMPQPVWMARPDGELSYVNKRVAEYFTKAGEEIVVKGWLDVVHPDDRERVIERWVLALQTGAKYEVEFRLLRASDGEYRWHLGLAEPVRSHGGEILHWVGTNTDIHDRKLAEQAANPASDGKSRFVSSISHELRSPLSAVIGFADLLETELAGRGLAERKTMCGAFGALQGICSGSLMSCWIWRRSSRGGWLFISRSSKLPRW